jgi:hypothetical protein
MDPYKTNFNGQDFFLYPVACNSGGYLCGFSVGEPNDNEMMRPYVRSGGKPIVYASLGAVQSEAPTHLQLYLENECGKMPQAMVGALKEFFERAIKELVDQDFEEFRVKREKGQE